VRRATSLVAVAVVAVVSACSSQGSSAGPFGTRSAAPVKVTVFAASSLTNAFTAEAAAFAQATGDQPTFSFAGSQELVAQVREGAPADAVATADLETMSKVPRGASAQVFARNRLVVIAGPGNPKHVTGLTDLARADLVVVLAAPAVPAGHYAVQALDAAHVTVHAKSLEDNVRGVLTKVALGEADAGIVYASDAKSAGKNVTTIPIPNSPVASYPALAVHPAGQAFVDFLLSAQGQAILTRYGFLPPR
jgi:molybdate transport system substrate-binding protein